MKVSSLILCLGKFKLFSVNIHFLRTAYYTFSFMVTDGVSLEISCLLLSKLHVFWGPGVDAIQKVLLKDGLVLLEELNSNYLLRDQCLAHEQYRQVNEYY